MRVRYLLVFIAICCLSGISYGQQISLVSTLAPRSEAYQLREYAILNGKLYFTTNRGINNVLWTTDGSSSGTVRIYEWKKASRIRNIGPFTVFGNRLFFAADDGTHGLELWSSDGTSNGTFMVKDIWPGSESGISEYGNNILKEMNGKLYFNGSDSVHAFSIWESDGTAANTKVALRLSPVDSTFIRPDALEVVNGRLFFVGGEWAKSSHFWSSDGTLAGTTVLKPDCAFMNLVPFGNRLLFSYGLGITDGTMSGTVILDSVLAMEQEHVIHNNEMVFIGRQKMFATDGTATGTRMIRDSMDLQAGLNLSGKKLVFPVVYKNRIYFCGTSSIWASDATVQGTGQLKTFPVDTTNYLSRYPTGLVSCAGKLFFKLYTAGSVELYMSDGTAAGTNLINMPGANYHYYVDSLGVDRHLHPGQFLDEPMMVVGNELYFMAVYDSALGKALYKLALPPTAAQTSANITSSLSIAPNPTSGTILIRYPEKLYSSVHVRDITGRIVHSRAINDNGQDALNLTSLPSGTYFIHLYGNDCTVSASVVIER